MPSHQPKKYFRFATTSATCKLIADYRGVGLAGKVVNLLLATATGASPSRNCKDF